MPKMSPILAILLPSILPSARFELVLAAIREVAISGIEVATDITVSPMTTGLILLLTEIEADPEVKPLRKVVLLPESCFKIEQESNFDSHSELNRHKPSNQA